MLRSPGPGVPASDEQPCGCWEPETTGRTPVFLTVESPLCLMLLKTFSVFTYLRPLTLLPFCYDFLTMIHPVIKRIPKSQQKFTYGLL